MRKEEVERIEIVGGGGRESGSGKFGSVEQLAKGGWVALRVYTEIDQT